MGQQRLYGVDRHAMLISHIAFADADCSCVACRLRRGEQLMERPRCPGRNPTPEIRAAAVRLATRGREDG
jgi:hypothetical protein